ncbi:MAG: stage II sporulation protein P, partial [Lacrimispora celerecrescens]|nr:stage II sporulation protein P [Lacrimispora celerecrescens]
EHSFLLYDGGEESGEDGSVNAGTKNAQGEQILETSSGQETADTNDQNQGQDVNAGKNDSLTCAASNVWPIVGTTYRKEQLADYDFLMKHFYSIHTSTTAGRDLMKADHFLAEDFTLEGGNDKPQILIYHTHSQEEFADHGPDKPDATVVGIGTYLTRLLTDKGYNVIHDTSVYDLQNGKLDRNKAYTYALEGITGILQKNPSIEVILDIHRDGVNESLHMVNQVNGKPTAPIMFFNGVSQTPEGPIEYLPNPYREKNLAFSFQMQLDSAAYFPNLTRKIYIKGLRYNQHLRARSSLIEVGAQTNTYQEALNAMEPLAEVLDMVLKGN